MNVETTKRSLNHPTMFFYLPKLIVDWFIIKWVSSPSSLEAERKYHQWSCLMVPDHLSSKQSDSSLSRTGLVLGGGDIMSSLPEHCCDSCEWRPRSLEWRDNQQFLSDFSTFYWDLLLGNEILFSTLSDCSIHIRKMFPRGNKVGLTSSQECCSEQSGEQTPTRVWALQLKTNYKTKNLVSCSHDIIDVLWSLLLFTHCTEH